MKAAFQFNLKRCPFFRFLQTNYFFKADPDYGARVDKYLELDVKEVEKLASMTKEEFAKATEKQIIFDYSCRFHRRKKSDFAVKS
ncbi:hypothetical protein [Methanohalophilus portucalensis]|uniref:Catalase n=2 Tax=Methanohalophilus portucalensis TaxID=39664 RepID=A0A1L9C1Y2_9EURY|nr:hypothetical protein [Methanohalophilus portucalensis]ATU09108.1 hypothetical protein BKM01_10215 [Methanohalophilus portucalensis]OJH48539.1 catalase [Methanohalophilus portucalensis FDF-1]